MRQYADGAKQTPTGAGPDPTGVLGDTGHSGQKDRRVTNVGIQYQRRRARSHAGRDRNAEALLTIAPHTHQRVFS